MNFTEPIKVGLSQLRANKMRSLLTILGILIGVGSVVGIVSIGEGLRQTLLTEFDRIGGSRLIWVMPPREWEREGGRWTQRAWREYITMGDVDAVQAESDRIEKVLPVVLGDARLQYKKASVDRRFQGTMTGYHRAMGWEVEHGRFISEKDIDRWRKICVIGSTIREELFGAGNPLGEEIKIRGERYLVVGVMEEKKIFDNDWGSWIFVPISTAQKRLTGDEHIGELLVYARQSGEVKYVVEEVKRVFRRRHKHGGEFVVESVEGQLKRIQKVLLILKLAAGGIAGISLLVGGIGIMNIMLVSVAERTREIGIRKAVGAKRRHILSQFIVESVVLSLFGGILGIVFALALGFGISKVVSNLAKQPFPSHISVVAVLLALGFSAVVGVFFGVYPAVRASRLNPVEALRYK